MKTQVRGYVSHLLLIYYVFCIILIKHHNENVDWEGGSREYLPPISLHDPRLIAGQWSYL